MPEVSSSQVEESFTTAVSSNKAALFALEYVVRLIGSLRDEADI